MYQTASRGLAEWPESFVGGKRRLADPILVDATEGRAELT